MKTFYQLLVNSIVASITNFTVWFAITFFVYLETRSVFATAVISGIYLVVTAISGFWFGSIVDHSKKKNTMLGSSIASLVVYVLSYWIYTTTEPSAFKDPTSVTLWIFVPVLMMGVIVGNIRTIALTTLITIMIPEDRRDKANGLASTAFGVSFLVTSVISGFLVGLAGMYYVLILAIVATSGAIIHLLLLSVPEDRVVAALSPGKNKIDIRGTFKVISEIPGLFALIMFTTFNNFLGGVLMALMDAYGLSLVSVETWGLLWGFLSTGFMVGGAIIAKFGLGKNPLRAIFLANLTIWTVSIFFTIQPSITLMVSGLYIFLCVVPYIEASEQTVMQKVVPPERQGRVFGFAQSVEQMASPLTAFLIGPIAQFIFIPYMTTGAGAELIGDWYGTGPDRGLALVFSLTGFIGFLATLVAFKSKYYKQLSERYLAGAPIPEPLV